MYIPIHRINSKGSLKQLLQWGVGRRYSFTRYDWWVCLQKGQRQRMSHGQTCIHQKVYNLSTQRLQYYMQRERSVTATHDYDVHIVHAWHGADSTLGCGRLWVTDGIWSLTFPHCMYKCRVSHCKASVHKCVISMHWDYIWHVPCIIYIIECRGRNSKPVASWHLFQWATAREGVLWRSLWLTIGYRPYIPNWPERISQTLLYWWADLFYNHHEHA